MLKEQKSLDNALADLRAEFGKADTIVKAYKLLRACMIEEIELKNAIREYLKSKEGEK